MESTETKASGVRSGPRPEIWKSGPDPAQRKKFYAWHRSRAQANYRHEGWTITFEQFDEIWGDQWHRRGRKPEDLQLIRIDFLAPWTHDNVAVVDRPTFSLKQIEIRKYYKTTPRTHARKV